MKALPQPKPKTRTKSLLRYSMRRSSPETTGVAATPTPDKSTASAVFVGKAASASPCAPHALPPLPPLVFSPSKGVHKRSPGATLRTYLDWTQSGFRPGLSVRFVRADVITSMPSVTEYMIHVLDLHTKVFWFTKKRFHELVLLRKKIRTMVRKSTAVEIEQLKFLMELPFPRRRFRSSSSPESATRRMDEMELFFRNVSALEPSSNLHRSILHEFQLEMCSVEFIASLEKIDTTGEPAEPKWLSYDLFMSLNNGGTVEGNTCFKFLQAFRNRCAMIEAAVCPECKKFEDKPLAAEALKDLRNVITNIEKFVVDNLHPQYADTMSLMEQSVNAQELIEDCVFHAVEDTILVPLEKPIAFLVGATIDLDVEARLARNIEKLRGRSQTELGIPEHLQSEDDFGLSCHHLSMMDERPLPIDKIHELLQSALEIFKSCGAKDLEWRENSALTADDYLPIHIYVVVKSGLKRPLFLKEYLGAMIHPSKMLGEIGYFLTMFEVALQYIADM